MASTHRDYYYAVPLATNVSNKYLHEKGLVRQYKQLKVKLLPLATNTYMTRELVRRQYRQR